MQRIPAILCALVLLCLCVTCATAELTEEDITSLAIQQAQTELQTMRDAAEGWTRLMLEDAQINGTEMRSDSVFVNISVPELGSTLSSSATSDGDAAAFLRSAMSDYLGHETRIALRLNMTWTEKDGEVTTKWSGTSSPKNLRAALREAAAKAKKGYTYRNFRQAAEDYLFPKCVTLPKKQPETLPEPESLADWAGEIGPAMGLTADQAEGRFRALLLMTTVTKLDGSGGLETTKLTLKVDDWQTLLDNALTGAKGLADLALGAPEMSREEIETLLWEALLDASKPLLFDGRGVKVQQLTVDLAAAVGKSRGECTGLTEWLGMFNTAFEQKLDLLAAYANTLPYYPTVPAINAGVLSGAQSEQGATITVDTGARMSGWVCIRRDGKTVLTGYARPNARLMVTLAAGEYEVLYTTGKTWYGEKYRFGSDAAFGSFPLTVPQTGLVRISLVAEAAATGTDLATPAELSAGKTGTVMTEAEFEAALGA